MPCRTRFCQFIPLNVTMFSASFAHITQRKCEEEDGQSLEDSPDRRFKSFKDAVFWKRTDGGGGGGAAGDRKASFVRIGAIKNRRRIGVVDAPEVNERAAGLVEWADVLAAARSADDGDVWEDAYVQH